MNDMTISLPNNAIITNIPATEAPQDNTEYKQDPLFFDMFLASSGTREFTEVRMHLLDKIKTALPSTLYPLQLRFNFEIVLANLLAAYSKHPLQYVHVSMSPNTYSMPARYRRNRISYTHISSIITSLLECGYIELQGGSYTKGRIQNYRTRIRASEKLAQVFETYGLKEQMVVPSPIQELIVLKANKEENIQAIKKLKGYSDTDLINDVRVFQQRQLLENYAALLNTAGIRLDNEPMAAHKFVIKRIFNNGSFKYGGRFYGGFHQSINSKARSHIIMNGNLTVELDFQNYHPFMLYQMAGIEKREDIYSLPEYSHRSDAAKFRKLVKKYVTTAINSTDKRELMQAMGFAILQDRKRDASNRIYPDGYVNIKELADFVETHNQPIMPYLANGCYGLKLQFMDSCIAEYVIRTLTERRISVLCIHDSFIVEKQNEELLRSTMEEGYKKVMKSDFAPTIENKITAVPNNVIIH